MHKTCKYYFETEVEKTKKFYNNLTGSTDNVEYKEMKECCGLHTSATIIKDNQPLCSHYVEKR